MRRFVAVWSLTRGIINPPEPLDAAGQYAANLEADIGDQQDRKELQRRATLRYQIERDRPLTRAECA
jgi:hypothetical protein